MGGSAHPGRPAGEGPISIGPARYAAWRASPLGALTAALEMRLLLELAGPLAGRQLLDVGCGDGALACTVAARGASVTGVDPDLAMLAAARARALDQGLHVRCLEGSLERLPFPDASADLVVAVTVLCFVPRAGVAVRELARVLRPGGRLVLGELGRWSTWAALRRVRGWRGSSTWSAATFRSAAHLRALAAGAGLTVGPVRGAIFYPPLELAASVMAPVDAWLGRRTTLGAAFIALGANKPPG